MNIKYIYDFFSWVYGLSTIVGYLMPNPIYIFIGLVGFCGISALEGYLMPNPLYSCVVNTWFVNAEFEDSIF